MFILMYCSGITYSSVTAECQIVGLMNKSKVKKAVKSNNLIYKKIDQLKRCKRMIMMNKMIYFNKMINDY